MLQRSPLLLSAVVLLLSKHLLPQAPTNNETVPFPSVGVSTWFSVVTIPPIPNAPFSATTIMDNTQTLADGTTVRTKTMTTIARDSKGRTHNENRYYLRPSDNGQGRIRDITIFDPNAHTRATLDPVALQAIVVTLPPKQPRTAPLAARLGPEREDLGTSTIDGLTVHGFRHSRTIPEGAIGNDRPIITTDEYWYSEELHVNITLKHTDPQHGTQIVTLTQLSRDEPDEKMFEIPAGYEAHSRAATEGTAATTGAVASRPIRLPPTLSTTLIPITRP